MHTHHGEIITDPKVEGVRGSYTNHKTDEHHCKLFGTEQEAENWLLDKGVDYDDILRATETDDPEDLPEEVREQLPPMPTPEQMNKQMKKPWSRWHLCTNPSTR